MQLWAAVQLAADLLVPAGDVEAASPGGWLFRCWLMRLQVCSKLVKRVPEGSVLRGPADGYAALPGPGFEQRVDYPLSERFHHAAEELEWGRARTRWRVPRWQLPAPDRHWFAAPLPMPAMVRPGLEQFVWLAPKSEYPAPDHHSQDRFAQVLSNAAHVWVRGELLLQDV